MILASALGPDPDSLACPLHREPDMQAKLMTTLVGATLVLGAGCATKTETGTATGAVAGGLIGGAVGDEVGLVLGAVLGGFLGREVGAAMEREDQRQIAYALEANRPVSWQNPNTGYAYEVQPTETHYERGYQCREFRMTADVGRDTEQVYGTACRQPDGSWEMVQAPSG